MSQWIPLTVSDIERHLAAPQVKALRERALAPGQPDPLPEILASVVAEVRAAVASQPRHRLSADPTLLPPELRLTAVLRALAVAQARLPGLSLSPDQEALAQQAERTLVRVANGSLWIGAADDATAEGESGAGTVVARRRASPLGSERLAILS